MQLDRRIESTGVVEEMVLEEMNCVDVNQEKGRNIGCSRIAQLVVREFKIHCTCKCNWASIDQDKWHVGVSPMDVVT